MQENDLGVGLVMRTKAKTPKNTKYFLHCSLRREKGNSKIIYLFRFQISIFFSSIYFLFILVILILDFFKRKKNKKFIPG